MVFRSLPLAALSLLLGFFFVFVGSIKITPKVNPDVYNDMVDKIYLFISRTSLFIFSILVISLKLSTTKLQTLHCYILIKKKKQQEFGRFNKVFPLYKFTGWRPYAKNYRYAVGLIECICGAILILIPGKNE